MSLNFGLLSARTIIAISALLISGCTTVDQVADEASSGNVNLSHDGTWIAKVTKYRHEQLALGFGHSRIRWTCGDGKPFQVRFNVSEGSVYLYRGKPVKVGRVSSKSTFKSIYSRDAEFTNVYTGNFDKKIGKIQSRKKGLNGCKYNFELVKQ